MTTTNRAAVALPTLLTCAALGMPTACAQPPTFPDLSRFTEITHDNPILTTNRSGNHTAVFSTPDGLICNADAHAQSCASTKTGAMPGFPPDSRHLDLSPCGAESESVNSSDAGSEFVYTRNCEGAGTPPVLHAGEKVSIIDTISCKMGDYQIPNCTPGDRGKATCVVGANRLTACTNGKHGFVIQPSGSWTF